MTFDAQTFDAEIFATVDRGLVPPSAITACIQRPNGRKIVRYTQLRGATTVTCEVEIAPEVDHSQPMEFGGFYGPTLATRLTQIGITNE